MADDINEATKFINKSEIIAINSGEKFYLPEIYRLKGIIQFSKNRDLDELSEYLHKSINLAETDGSIFWKNRTQNTIDELL